MSDCGSDIGISRNHNHIGIMGIDSELMTLDSIRIIIINRKVAMDPVVPVGIVLVENYNFFF